MRNSATFTLIAALLIFAGSYGVYSILEDKGLIFEANSYESADLLAKDNKETTQITSLIEQRNTNTQKPYQPTVNEVVTLLNNQQYSVAVELVDSLYRQLSSDQIQEFANLFLNTASKLRQSGQQLQAITLLTHYNEAFNDLDGWVLLSDIQLENKQWQPAINSLLKAAAIEYQPDRLQILMSHLVNAASAQRAILERQKDELSINQLYQKLYAHHPSNTRFQLELASSYLRLNDTVTARGILEPLQYDAELGEIAKTALALLEENSSSKVDQQNIDKKSDYDINNGEVVVPLLRSGNSFFVNTVVNDRQLRLLLDTGASITALSESSIESLNLKATGQHIRLNTANGTRSAELFQTDKIKLGNLSIENLVVAEIEFEKNSQIHGLLGTDLLNQLDNRYTYIIDNQSNSLIFKPKK